MEIISYNLRSIFLGVIVGAGSVVLQQMAYNDSDYLLLGVALLYFLIMSAIGINYLTARRKLRQFGLPALDQTSDTSEFLHHIIMPSITLLGIAGFIYTNNSLNFGLIYLITNSIIFSLLFINIKAYYENKFKSEQHTHYIYDILKIINFFTLTVSLLNIADTFGFNFFVQAGTIWFYTTTLMMLLLFKKTRLYWFDLLLILLGGLALGYAIPSIAILVAVNNLVVGFIGTMLFYIVNAIISHEIENTLTLQIVYEYFLVSMICFVIILLFI